MPLYQDNGLERERRQLELATLALPGPAVVIDVRHSDDEDTQLLWYLAIELEDLTLEMRLDQVHQWRHLAQCFDFLKLDALPLEAPLNGTSEFLLTTRTDKRIPILGASHLAKFVGRHFLDRVRNKRNDAIRDFGNDISNMSFETASPDISTVRVFFLTDLEDERSFIRAAKYADWLKAWNDTADGPGLTPPGRDERINAIAVCMNANLHYHENLLTTVAASHTGLDTVVLIERYSDNDMFIGRNAQIYQAELLLYTLLLYWPRSLETTHWKTVNDPDGQQTLPWPIYVAGTSALEYSARWATRWLDYGLAAKTIEMLRDWQDAEYEEKQVELDVQQWWDDWWKRFRAKIPGVLIAANPDLQVLDTLPGLMRSLRLEARSQISSLESLKECCGQVNQLYTDTGGMSLERAMNSAANIPWQFKQAYTRPQENTEERIPIKEAYEISELYTQLQLFLLPLFHEARGAIPRALHQITSLNKHITALRLLQQNPPKLREQREEFEYQADLAQKRLEQIIKQWHWPGGRKVQHELDEIYTQLYQIVQKHLNDVYDYIAARIALMLLQWADLYDPSGKICPYQLRLTHLDEALKVAQAQATQQQEIADKRLKLNYEQRYEDFLQAPDWLRLNNRTDLLQWDQITDAFLKSCEILKSSSDKSNLLAETMLRWLGTEKPSINGRSRSNRTYQLNPLPQEEEMQQIQIVSTLLVALLLSAKVGDIDIATLDPLLKQYAALKEPYLPSSSVLESDVLDIRHVIKQVRLEQEIQGKGNIRSPMIQEPSVEFALAAWVNAQHTSNSLLADALDSSGVLVRLRKAKVDVSQVIDAFRRQTRLMGRNDTIAGNDHFYLLLAPGDAEDVSLDTAQVQHIRFPDAEKLIYLHVHRIRQLPSGPFINDEG